MVVLAGLYEKYAIHRMLWEIKLCFFATLNGDTAIISITPAKRNKGASVVTTSFKWKFVPSMMHPTENCPTKSKLNVLAKPTIDAGYFTLMMLGSADIHWPNIMRIFNFVFRSDNIPSKCMAKSMIHFNFVAFTSRQQTNTITPTTKRAISCGDRMAV